MDRMSLMPAHSMSARTGPPAMTPVPGAAGFSNDARAGLAHDLMGDGGAHHREPRTSSAASLLDALGDRGRHLLRLAVAHPDAPGAVTNDDQRREREPAAALNHLGHAVDGDDPLFVRALLCRSLRRSVASDLQSSLTRTVGDRRDAAVEPSAAAIEDRPADAGPSRARRSARPPPSPWRSGRRPRPRRRSRRDGQRGAVVDHLRVDVPVRPVHG